jgi:hypothetical protein
MSDALEPTPQANLERGRVARVLLAPGFWINFLATLLLTCWLPGVKSVLKTEDGTVIQELSVPLYHCYWRLIQGEYSRETLQAMGMHLGIVFIVTFAIWLAFAGRRRRNAVAPE